jgi:transcriptional regulator with XRE-family HTH domain
LQREKIKMILKEFRERFSLTQAEAGLLLGLSERQIRNLESGVHRLRPILRDLIKAYPNFIPVQCDYDNWMVDYDIAPQKGCNCFAVIFSDIESTGAIEAAINENNLPRLILEVYDSSRDEAALDPFRYKFIEIKDAIAL